jgi:tetratricopeptide (TPR) repeat protein
MTRSTLFATALVALSATSAWAQGSFDVVVTLEGPPKRGTVTEMSKDSVGLEVSGGVTTQVEVNNVKQVVFADAPAQMRSAQTSLAGGQIEDALEKLNQIKQDDVQRPIVWKEVVYYKAYCMAKLALVGGGDKTAAARVMGEFAKTEGEYAGTYHYYEANEIMGDLAGSLGKPDVAAKFYAAVGEAPWPDFKMKAAVLEGQALVAQGNYKDAYGKFSDVLKSQLNTPVAARMKDFATLGKAVCLSEAGKADEGVTEVEKIIANGDSKDGELFARAYNALGHCHAKAGRTKDALLAYLHVDLMFYQDPAQHAESLYHLASLWKDVDKTEQSLKARTLLKQRYPGSVWAGKPG